MAQEKTTNDFDIAAEKAENELQNIFLSLSEEEKRGALAICRWHSDNYQESGHKRLGRILLDIGNCK